MASAGFRNRHSAAKTRFAFCGRCFLGDMLQRPMPVVIMFKAIRSATLQGKRLMQRIEGSRKMVAELPLRLFTVEEFHQMGETGILDEDDRIELIEGRIVSMAPIGMRHALCVANLSELFFERLGRRVRVWTQNPLRFGGDTELYPDVVLLRRDSPAPAREIPKIPTPGDVILIIEVADSTLRTDRKVKMPMYARWGIQDAWIVDLDKGAVEVYSQPDGASYSTVERAARGQSITVPGFDGITIQVDEILAEV